MADEPDNIVRMFLRRLDEKVDRLAADMQEVKQRLGILETQYASLSNRLDRMDIRLDRIERRLDPVPTP